MIVQSAGERSLDMEGVRGSIPLPPTIHIKMLARWAFGLAHEMPMKPISSEMICIEADVSPPTKNCSDEQMAVANRP